MGEELKLGFCYLSGIQAMPLSITITLETNSAIEIIQLINLLEAKHVYLDFAFEPVPETLSCSLA